MPKKKQTKHKDEVIMENTEQSKEENVINDEAVVEKDENTPNQEEIIEGLKTEINALNDKNLRLNAEFQNFSKRVEKEKSDIFKFGNEKLFIELITIMDNFERAMNTIDSEKTDAKFLEGLNLIKRSFEEVFEKNGVKKINALGEAFNHDFHHAVLTEAKEGVPSETVIEVLQEGYMLSERVIRPSMVKVSE